MTEGRTIELTGEDIDLLTAQLGESWVDAFLSDERTRREAIVRLCRAVDELTDLEFSMAARLVESIFHPNATNDVVLALAGLVSDSTKREKIATLTVAVLVTDAVTNVFTAGQMPGRNRHQRRVDGNGCTCGWSGRDMLSHLLGARREQEVKALAPLEELAFEANRQFRELLRDPQWSAAYWSARNQADDVQAERSAAFAFPVDTYDWKRPPGRLLAEWAERRSLSNRDVAQMCDLPLDVYEGILLGSERITTNIAIHLEAGTSTYPANVWLMLERNYRAALVERAHEPHH